MLQRKRKNSLNVMSSWMIEMTSYQVDNSKVELIKFKTPFEQHEVLKNPVLTETNDWFKIKELIEEIAE